MLPTFASYRRVMGVDAMRQLTVDGVIASIYMSYLVDEHVGHGYC